MTTKIVTSQTRAVIPALNGGLLPIGRYSSTPAEVESRFVSGASWASSVTRRTIWDHWELITSFTRSIVPVAAAWLGGSFLTDKMDPDDLDIVYFLDSRHTSAITDPAAITYLGLLATKGAIRSAGYRLDTFVVEWVPDPACQGAVPGFTQYAMDRGYWDDLWQRKIAGPKTAPRVPSDALPVRGYVEVTIDGFTA